MGQAKKILVVDDTAFMLAVIGQVLRGENYEVITASSGEQALEWLKTGKPDLILLDGIMTGISGYEVLQVLRDSFRYNLIPIIMLTGQSEDEDRLKGLEMGADDYIVKPFNNRELLARVRNTLVRLERSRGANPLTGLRGNNDIEMEMGGRLEKGEDFAVLYFDLNSFKPYNDVYGFSSGDLVIKATADILADALAEIGDATDFLGHIGGDDFIIVSRERVAIPLAEYIVQHFEQEMPRLYTPEDAERGYITAKDRNGVEAQFPLLGLSVAIVFTQGKNIASTAHLAEVAAELKKEAKIVANGRSAYVY